MFRNADKNSAYRKTFHGINPETKKDIVVEVKVPRCKKCKEHEPPTIPVVVFFIIVFVLLQIYEFKEYDFSVGERIAGLFVGGAMSIIPTSIFYLLLKIIVVFLRKPEFKVDDYKPIKKLKEVGFAEIGKKEYDRDKLRNKTLQSIVKEDKCVIRYNYTETV
jgi:hypothetical protein